MDAFISLHSSSSDGNRKEQVILGLAEWIQNGSKDSVSLDGKGLAGLELKDLETIVEMTDCLLLSAEAVEFIARKIFLLIRYSSIMKSQDGYSLLCNLLAKSMVVCPSWGIARLGADEFINHPIALKLSVDQFADLLSLDGLFLDEGELVQRAIEWCEDKPADEIARIMKCIRWDKLDSIQFPHLVNDLFSSDHRLGICKAFPEILLKLAQVTKTYSQDSSLEEFEPSPDRRGSELVWRRFIANLEDPDTDVKGLVGMVCLNPNPTDLSLSESFIDRTGWYGKGMYIYVQSGSGPGPGLGPEYELHLLDEWVSHAQINRCKDKSLIIYRYKNGESKCTLTTKFTGTYFVRIGPRIPQTIDESNNFHD